MGRHPVFHDGVHFILVHFNPGLFHDLQKTNSEKFRVHPEFVGLDIVRDGSENAITAVLHNFLNFFLCLSFNLGQKSIGVSADGSLIEVARLEQGGRDSFVHAFLGVVLQQKFESGKDTNRPDGITDEASIDGDQVDGTDNIIHHVLVQGVDGVAVLLRERSKRLSDGSDVGIDVIGSSVFAGEIGVGSTGFVGNLL